MRMLVEIKIPTERFNSALRDGTADSSMQKILADTPAEAVYFSPRDGQRGVTLVVDMTDPAQIPALAEPWFLKFDAKVSIQPIMSKEDLKRAGLEQLAKKWA